MQASRLYSHATWVGNVSRHHGFWHLVIKATHIVVIWFERLIGSSRLLGEKLGAIWSVGLTGLGDRSIKALSNTTILNGLAGLRHLLFVLFVKFIFGEKLGTDGQLEDVMLWHDLEGVLDISGHLLILRDSNCDYHFLDHTWSNYSVFFLLYKDAFVCNGFDGDAMSNHIFVLDGHDDVIRRPRSETTKHNWAW